MAPRSAWHLVTARSSRPHPNPHPAAATLPGGNLLLRPGRAGCTIPLPSTPSIFKHAIFRGIKLGSPPRPLHDTGPATLRRPLPARGQAWGVGSVRYPAERLVGQQPHRRLGNHHASRGTSAILPATPPRPERTTQSTRVIRPIGRPAPTRPEPEPETAVPNKSSARQTLASSPGLDYPRATSAGTLLVAAWRQATWWLRDYARAAAASATLGQPRPPGLGHRHFGTPSEQQPNNIGIP